MSGSCQEALPIVRQWSGSLFRCPGVVGRPSRMSGTLSRMFESGWETLTNVRDSIPDIREWSGEPHKCPGRPSGCPGVVERPFRMSGSGWEALPDVQE